LVLSFGASYKKTPKAPAKEEPKKDAPPGETKPAPEAPPAAK
jgi:hypothetical protein